MAALESRGGHASGGLDGLAQARGPGATGILLGRRADDLLEQAVEVKSAKPGLACQRIE